METKNSTKGDVISGKEILRNKIKKADFKQKYSKDKIKNMSLNKNTDNQKEYVKKIDSLNTFK